MFNSEFVSFSVALVITFLIAGILAFGKEVTLHKATAENYVNWLDSRGLFPFAFKSVAVMVVATIILALFVHLFSVYDQHYFGYIVLTTTSAMLCEIVFEQLGIFRNSRLRSVTSIVAGIFFCWYCYHHPNLLTKNLASLVVILVLLISLRNVKLRAFLALGFGILVFDAISVFWTHQMIQIANQTADDPVGMILYTTEIGKTWHLISTGIGDVIFPGILMMIAYRQSKSLGGISLWVGTVVGYIAGMMVTTFVMFVYSHPQPATIYLIPGAYVGYYVVVKFRKLPWSKLTVE